MHPEMRRAVLPLALVAVMGLAGWQQAAAQARKDAARDAKATATFELYKDRAGDFRFRLKGDDGMLLAMSAKGFRTKAECQKLIEAIKRDVAKARFEDADRPEKAAAAKAAVIFEMYKDRSGDYRFRLKDGGGDVLAIASKGYRTKADCQKVLDAIKRDAARARLEDEGK
jgi:uncharacterized protein YegP (UPF0339 family)